MARPPIRANDLIADIRNGMDDDGLMKKYQLSPTQLATVFTRLVEAKSMTQAELDTRFLIMDSDLGVPGTKGETQTSWEAIQEKATSVPVQKKPWTSSEKAILGETNHFVIGTFIAVCVLGFVSSSRIPQSSILGLAVIMFLYLVIRASLALKQPLWQTVLYGLAVIIQIGVPIVVIALIVQFKTAYNRAHERETLNQEKNHP
jgi:hypothetical protein